MIMYPLKKFTNACFSELDRKEKVSQEKHGDLRNKSQKNVSQLHDSVGWPAGPNHQTLGKKQYRYTSEDATFGRQRQSRQDASCMPGSLSELNCISIISWDGDSN